MNSVFNGKKDDLVYLFLLKPINLFCWQIFFPTSEL